MADLVTFARTEVGPTVTTDSIRLALDNFHEANLLAGPLADGMSPARPTRSRRRLLKEAGLAGIAVPVIASVTAPAAAAQVSCLPLNSACGTGIPCCSPHRECRSGRCCFPDSQPCTDDALLVNTRRLSRFEIDPASATARIEAGVKWEPVLALAAQYDLSPLVGSAPDVGAVGYLTGGGLPMLNRQFGFAADRIRSLRMVTADGQVRNVSAGREPDLF